ncbi:helix-turn-helix domain-containing protein [Photobacterium sp.]|uniref:helix-turn-helix domain-containing protein n=1 Tax=Photobacterium sp. TaxID=660 RepID=UPI0039B05D5D
MAPIGKKLISLQWVQDGLTINEVAALSGYNNVSAYIEAFRQRFGETPGIF